ncbi:MAG: hypothetical protein QXP42_04540 [Candidatus Micrarchaeia archaeon]
MSFGKIVPYWQAVFEDFNVVDYVITLIVGVIPLVNIAFFGWAKSLVNGFMNKKTEFFGISPNNIVACFVDGIKLLVFTLISGIAIAICCFVVSIVFTVLAIILGGINGLLGTIVMLVGMLVLWIVALVLALFVLLPAMLEFCVKENYLGILQFRKYLSATLNGRWIVALIAAVIALLPAIIFIGMPVAYYASYRILSEEYAELSKGK